MNGEHWKLGCNWSGFYALDIDKPEVQDYLSRVFNRVFNEWGFDFVKLDFLYGAAPFGSSTETRAGRMRRALEFLRKLTEGKTVLLCGVPMMPAFGLFEYARIGCDVTLDLDGPPLMRLAHMERPSTLNAIQNMLTRYPLDQRAFGNDPDVFFLRSYNIQLDQDQRLCLATLDALLGSVFLTSDDPSRYTPEMKEMYRKLRHLSTATNVRLGTAGIGDLLTDAFVAGTSPEYATVMDVSRRFSLTSGWKPAAGSKVLIYHSTEDDLVPYANYPAMKAYLDAVAGDCDITWSSGANGGHVAAYVQFFLKVLPLWN